MKRIKKSSKAGSLYLYRYEHAEATSVEQFYKQPSNVKLYLEKECLKKMFAENGEGYKILGGNSFVFTAAWRTAEGLRVETYTNSFLIC